MLIKQIGRRGFELALLLKSVSLNSGGDDVKRKGKKKGEKMRRNTKKRRMERNR